MDTPSTIGVDFVHKNLILGDNKTIYISCWDTAGQERFRSIISLYYYGSAAILVFYDVTNRNSFENVPSWVSEVRNNVTRDVEISIVANMIDKKNRQVTSLEGKEMAEKLDAMYIESSSKNNNNVMDVMFTISDNWAKQTECGPIENWMDLSNTPSLCMRKCTI